MHISGVWNKNFHTQVAWGVVEGQTFLQTKGDKKITRGIYVIGGGGVDLMMLMVKEVSKPSAEAKTFVGPYVPEILGSNNCIY